MGGVRKRRWPLDWLHLHCPLRDSPMLEYQDKTVQEVAACPCDRCQRRMTPDDTPWEWAEKLSIVFTAGYGSIFGDGCKVEIDLCQQCVKETLGAWLRITPSDVWAVSETDTAHLQRSPTNAAHLERSIAQLRSSVRRYDDPTEPVSPTDNKPL
jgi:hypothetical protein